MKKMIAWLLMITMCFSLIPVNVWADSNDAVSTDMGMEDPALSPSSYIGELLTRKIEDADGENNEVFPGAILDVVVNGKTATIEFSTERPSELVVAIYEEDGIHMLGSGSKTVNSDEETASVEIDIEEMPAYFVVGVYLLDEQTHEPLSREFISKYYTREFQDFLATSVSDYDAAHVVNLDESDTTNFLVLNESVLIVDEQSSVSIVDNLDGTFTVSNPDASFLALKPGDSFSYRKPDSTVVAVVVKAATVSGGTMLITADQDADLDDLFAYYKIETDSYDKETYVDMSNSAPGVTYVGSEDVSIQSFAPSGDAVFIQSEVPVPGLEQNTTVVFDESSETLSASFPAAVPLIVLV